MKSSLILWNPKTREGWRLSSLLSVFNIFGASIMLMMWGPCYHTSKHERTVISGLRMAEIVFVGRIDIYVRFQWLMYVKLKTLFIYSKFSPVRTV